MIDHNNRRGSRNRKNNPKSIAVAAAVLVLFQIFSAADGAFARSAIVTVLVPVVAIAIFFAIFFFIAKFALKTKAKEDSSSNEDGYCKTCSDDFVYNNRQYEYNENSAEENFLRDKQRRIRQLDGFLKNGLIDKDEYLKLRSRYEK